MYCYETIGLGTKPSLRRFSPPQGEPPACAAAAGSARTGKLVFAQALAQALCANRRARGRRHAVGCSACQLVRSGHASRLSPDRARQGRRRRRRGGGEENEHRGGPDSHPARLHQPVEPSRRSQSGPGAPGRGAQRQRGERAAQEPGGAASRARISSWSRTVRTSCCRRSRAAASKCLCPRPTPLPPPHGWQGRACASRRLR